MMNLDYSRFMRKHLTIKIRLGLMIFIPLLIYTLLISSKSIQNKNRLSEEKAKAIHTHAESTLTAISKLALQMGNKILIEQAAHAAIESTLISSICVLDREHNIYFRTGSKAECQATGHNIDVYRDAIDEGDDHNEIDLEFDKDTSDNEAKTRDAIKIGSIKYALNMEPFHQRLTNELIHEIITLIGIIIGCSPLFFLFYHSIMKPTGAIINTVNDHDKRQNKSTIAIKPEYADELEYAQAALLESYKKVDIKTSQLEQKTSELEHQISMTVREKDKADKANASKSEFLSMVSHEVRGPIATVFGLMEVLSKTELSPHNKNIVQLSFNAMEPLITLLEDLMHFSSLDHRRFSIYLSYYDLVDEFQKSLSFFSKQAINNNIKLSFSVSNKAFFKEYLIETDRLRVRQVLHNLISNAYKFTSEGFIQVALNIDPERKNLVFKVEDSGMGIDQNKQSMIFNKFEQLHDHISTRKNGGIGIGLTICKKICNSMGGNITVQSEIGKGSCFSVQLPINYEARKKINTNIESQSTEEAFSFHKLNLKMLIVEDNGIMKLTTSRLLKEVGIIVDQAANAEEAQHLYKNNTYDIAVVDCYMPITSGFEVAQFMRDYERLNRLSRTPIIGVSASTHPETKECAIESGMDNFLTKPYKISQLYNVIQDILATQKQIQSALSVSVTNPY